MKHILITLLLLSTGVIPSQAQFYPTQYRPPNLNWQQLITPNFQVVYPQGEDSSALKVAELLENHYSQTSNLTGSSLKRFPVILNNHNDLSNGFVTPLHFRSEIELVPFKGKSINPRSGTWLEAVTPHELVHAMHFNNLGSGGFTSFISLFSPDIARSIHGAVPLGVHEGLAVYYETEYVQKQGGRGNYPYFTNQFNAVFDDSQRWNMGQLLQIVSDTRPFNRHYLGGYQFTSWLQRQYGTETSKDAIDFYADYPFLGYGVALRHATGKWPGQLYNEFETDKRQQLNSRHPLDFRDYSPLAIPFNGASVRRPMWLTDSTLVFFGSFYNARAGFYLYELNSNEISRLATTDMVRDFNYDLSSDRSRLVYSFYETNPVYTNSFKAELVELDLESGSRRQLSSGGRLYAPVYFGQKYLSLQSDHTFNRLVRFDPSTEQKVESLVSVKGVKINSVAVHPEDPDLLAVVAHKGTVQALWVGHISELENKLRGAPDVAFKQGSVFDPAWHPEGSHVLFSADVSNALNIYEYDIQSKTITRLTNSKYNAFEASYSPDGNRIAFIVQKGNEQLPVVIPRRNSSNQQITARQPTIQSEAVNTISTNGNRGARQEEWTTKPYTSGFSWLRPRAVLPVIDDVSDRGRYMYGASFHSNDLLQQQSYSAEVSYFHDRLWYDLSYQNTSFYPGFELSLFSKPTFVDLTFTSESDTVSQTMLRQERSFSLSVPIRYVLEQNVYYSSFLVRPKIRQSQIRFFESDDPRSTPSDFADVTIGNIYASFNYKLQQNIRDVQPNTGLLLFTEMERYFRPSGLTINTMGADYSRRFINSYAFRSGIFAYFSPLRMWNQSLRLDARILNQNTPIFDNQFLVSNGFSESIFPGSGRLLSVGTRYTIPLWFPDDGGFLIPAYLSNVYLVIFSDTVAPYDQNNFLSASRTVIGGGLRVRFRLSNLAFDIGLGIGYEPTRNQTNIFVGDF